MKISPRLPLVLDENDGAYASVDDYKELVNQYLRTLILTAPGEKIMHPNYGVGVRNYLFENNVSDIVSRIHSQVARYLPFVNLLDVNLEVDGNYADIEIKYNVQPLGFSANLSFRVTT